MKSKSKKNWTNFCTRSGQSENERCNKQRRYRRGFNEFCKNAFLSGWSTIKLYFMIGLPYETVEDVKGIAELSQKW